MIPSKFHKTRVFLNQKSPFWFLKYFKIKLLFVNQNRYKPKTSNSNPKSPKQTSQAYAKTHHLTRVYLKPECRNLEVSWCP